MNVQTGYGFYIDLGDGVFEYLNILNIINRSCNFESQAVVNFNLDCAINELHLLLY